MISISRLVNLTALLVVTSLPILCGCSDTAETEPVVQIQPLTELNDVQAKQKDQANEARKQLFTSLLAELMSSLGENGPAKSIRVCKTRAPELAEEISQSSGARIGRTSFRLRNPDNLPPKWAAGFVNQQVQDEVAVELPDDATGFLFPIRLMSTCLMCHGDDQQVSPDVKAAIVSAYPKDQATGFAEGDLRGYFWVEVPKPADRP